MLKAVEMKLIKQVLLRRKIHDDGSDIKSLQVECIPNQSFKGKLQSKEKLSSDVFERA